MGLALQLGPDFLLAPAGIVSDKGIRPGYALEEALGAALDPEAQVGPATLGAAACDPRCCGLRVPVCQKPHSHVLEAAALGASESAAPVGE